MVRKWTEVFTVLVLEPEVKIVTRGIPYKFAILKSPKINTLWEPFHHFLLEYQNSMKPAYLKRGNKNIPQVRISYLEGLKYQSCIRCSSSQLKSLKIRVFKVSEVMEV